MKPLAVTRTYQELIDAFRARAEQLEMTREAMDADGGLPSGYSGNLLAPRTIKHMGRVSFGAVLGILGLALVVVEDQARPVSAARRRKTPNKSHALRRPNTRPVLTPCGTERPPSTKK